MRNWPTWIPAPNSWMSAILLILLMRGVSVILDLIIRMGDPLIALSPKWKLVLYIAGLLSPILIIAVAHHLLHLALDRFFPNTRPPEMSRATGLFPSLLSWWEGLYGWQVFTLAVLVSSAIQLIFLSSFNALYEMLDWWDEIKHFFTISNLIRLITLAYLYQFEQLVRQHLMSIGSATQSDQQYD